MFPGMTSVKDWGSKIMQEKINCKPVETEASIAHRAESRLLFPGL